MQAYSRIACAALATVLVSLPAFSPGQMLSELPPSQPYKWSLRALPERPAPGDTVWIAATLDIAEQHFVYARRTSVTIEPAPHYSIGNTQVPRATVSFDRFEGTDVAKLKGRAEFRTPLFLNRSVPPGELTIRAVLRTQGCSEEVCFFPSEKAATARVVVTEGPPASGPSDTTGILPLQEYSGSLPQSDSPQQEAPPSFADFFDLSAVMARRGSGMALFILFIGGILTSFTPCVYPLIPITISFFGAQGARGVKVSRVRSLVLTSVFVLGMAFMYSALGVIAAATGAVFGSIMANPLVVSAVAILFIAFAASMFGAFEITLPASLQTRLAAIGGGGGYAGVFAAGLVAGIVAAPCTGPVLGAVLTYIATTGNVPFGFTAMFVFALGMGLLFLVIGTFSARVVPGSGPWLEKIKNVFGIVMLVMALYFLKDVFPALKAIPGSGPGLLTVAALFVAVGVAIGAIHLRFKRGIRRNGEPEPDPSLSERVRKAVGVILCVAGVYGILHGVASPLRPTLSRAATQINWEHDEAAGFARAKAMGMPVIVDAYAEWCAACRELEAVTFADPRVQERLRSYVAIRLDFTESTESSRRLQRKHGIVGLPTVLLFDEHGVEQKNRRLMGFEPPDAFLRRLER